MNKPESRLAEDRELAVAGEMPSFTPSMEAGLRLDQIRSSLSATEQRVFDRYVEEGSQYYEAFQQLRWGEFYDEHRFLDERSHDAALDEFRRQHYTLPLDALRKECVEEIEATYVSQGRSVAEISTAFDTCLRGISFPIENS